MAKTLYPAKTGKRVDWSFVIMATLMTCFFGILIALMIAGFKGVESGLVYNGSWI